ncbi:MAG TPA: thioesterase family protein [Chitinophagaceae bacterium]|nr:thioesterase family protein [Chitinophagaceae bacterium]
MPRIKIDFPVKYFNIEINIPVRITDVNYGDHVGNDSLVAIIHEARMQFLQHYGYTELNIEGIGLIMSDLIVEFKNESFYKDIMQVKIGRGDISKVSFELIYQLTTLRENKKIVIANAKTTMICFDYKLKKVVSLPQKLKAIL